MLLPTRHTAHRPRDVPDVFSPHARIRVSERRVTAVRHGKLATHTGETGHPQLHPGSLTAHHADLCMPVQRLVLAPRRGGHTGASRHPKGAISLGRDCRQEEYISLFVTYTTTLCCLWQQRMCGLCEPTSFPHPLSRDAETSLLQAEYLGGI